MCLIIPRSETHYRCLTRRTAYNEVGFHGDFRYELPAPFDSVQQRARCQFAHFLERLTHGGKARNGMHSNLNIVESHNGNVLGNTQPGFLNGPNGANGGDVVVCKQCCERLVTGEQLSSRKDSPTEV